jgi:hypothetical protein
MAKCGSILLRKREALQSRVKSVGIGSGQNDRPISTRQIAGTVISIEAFTIAKRFFENS